MDKGKSPFYCPNDSWHSIKLISTTSYSPGGRHLCQVPPKHSLFQPLLFVLKMRWVSPSVVCRDWFKGGIMINVIVLRCWHTLGISGGFIKIPTFGIPPERVWFSKSWWGRGSRLILNNFPAILRLMLRARAPLWAPQEWWESGTPGFAKSVRTTLLPRGYVILGWLTHHKPRARPEFPV